MAKPTAGQVAGALWVISKCIADDKKSSDSKKGGK